MVASVLLACVGCKSRNTTPTGPGPIVDLDTRVTGLSGLTRDGKGMLWAAGEHADAVLRMRADGTGIEEYEVVGAPPGADLEALAWLEGNRFLLGTETQEAGRANDVLLEGVAADGRFVVRPRARLAYAAWGLSAPKNRGIEGLCHVEGSLVLATELVDEQEGRRWAPVAMLDLADNTWSTYWVALTSKTGKLAGLGCRKIEGEVVALAVERHFGVSRLLRFSLRKSEAGKRIEPEVAADLAKVMQPIPNFEGVVWDDDGSVILLTDNHYRGRAPDPSRLYFVPASVLK